MKLLLDTDKIERKRLAKGMLKGDVARAAGLHLNSVVTATKGRPVGLCVARKIATALGLSVRSLIASIVPDDEQQEPAAPAAAPCMREAG